MSSAPGATRTPWSEPPSTAATCDACVSVELPFGVAPAGLASSTPVRISGPARPVRHRGSVDDLLEAIGSASPGDVLVVDNGGRLDEGCLGDLIALEGKLAGLGGIVLWGAHRDRVRVTELEFPVFSYATCPAGPIEDPRRKREPKEPVRFGAHVIDQQTATVVDEDGAVFFPRTGEDAVYARAREIEAAEADQTKLALAGTSLRRQLHFAEYLRRSAADPDYSLNVHVRSIGVRFEI